VSGLVVECCRNSKANCISRLTLVRLIKCTNLVIIYVSNLVRLFPHCTNPLAFASRSLQLNTFDSGQLMEGPKIAKYALISSTRHIYTILSSESANSQTRACQMLSFRTLISQRTPGCIKICWRWRGSLIGLR
jgi:hypothetical protein